MMVVVTGVGGYIPLYRVKRADIAAQSMDSESGETAVPAPDENHVTMATEASEIALYRAGVEGDTLTAVLTASVSDLFAEHGIAAHVAYRFGATGDVRTGDFGGSTRAATDALMLGFDHIRAEGGRALVVGVDVLPTNPEDDGLIHAGAGAGAVVLEKESNDPLATITGVGQSTTGFVERHRLHGEPPIKLDDRFERSTGVPEATKPAIADALGDKSLGVAIVGTADPRDAKTILRNYGADRVSIYEKIGHVGAASSFIDLAHTIERNSGDFVLMVVYGSGGADAVAMDTYPMPHDEYTVEEQLKSKEYVTYSQHLRYREPVDYQGVTR